MPATPEQQAVIDAQVGVVVVSACPGSGKTFTVKERALAIPRLESVVMVAFNKKAAEEMARRVGAQAGRDSRTLHSYCFRELRTRPEDYGLKGKLDVRDTGFKVLCEANGVEYYGWDDSPWDADLVAWAERSLYDEELEKLCESDDEDVATWKAVRALRRWQMRHSVVSFDAMVRLVAEPEARKRLRFGADHLMVDEFQDVDKFQFDIIKTLGKQAESLCVVGDPNQRIYEWRGALEDSFQAAVEEFPGARQLSLTCNFRSKDEVLQFAEEICPVGMHGVRGSGEDVVVGQEAWNEVRELRILAGWAGRGDVRLAERAVLCRTNKACAEWQLVLARAGVPVYMLGKSDFWNAREVVLALEAREHGQTAAMLFGTPTWERYARRRFFREKPEALTEAMETATWIVELKAADLDLLRGCLQNEAEGLRISTIHKTKGMEFERVMVSGVDEKLRRETFVWYVAATRAMDQLVLG